MTTSTLTLAAFVSARLDEDEAAALAATGGHWSSLGSHRGTHLLAVVNEPPAHPRWEGVVAAEREPDAAHIARHDPARVLAEVAAKRAILDMHEDARQARDVYNRGHEAGDLTTADDLRFRLDANVRWAALDRTLNALAAVYSDHPDYDERWRP